jgi:hypothetical protein
MMIQTQVSDELLEQIQTIAQQENLSVEQVISQALITQVSVWEKHSYLQKRAKKGSWEHFQSVLSQVPDCEPDELDRL